MTVISLDQAGKTEQRWNNYEKLPSMNVPRHKSYPALEYDIVKRNMHMEHAMRSCYGLIFMMTNFYVVNNWKQANK